MRTFGEYIDVEVWNIPLFASILFFAFGVAFLFISFLMALADNFDPVFALWGSPLIVFGSIGSLYFDYRLKKARKKQRDNHNKQEEEEVK